MKLVIDKFKYEEGFVKKFLPLLIKKNILRDCNMLKLRNIDNEFGINSYRILEIAADNIVVSEIGTNYIIQFNSNIKYRGNTLDKLIKIITFGNRTVKGYSAVQKVFSFIAENLDILYKEWLD